MINIQIKGAARWEINRNTFEVAGKVRDILALVRVNSFTDIDSEASSIVDEDEGELMIEELTITWIWTGNQLEVGFSHGSDRLRNDSSIGADTDEDAL